MKSNKGQSALKSCALGPCLFCLNFQDIAACSLLLPGKSMPTQTVSLLFTIVRKIQAHICDVGPQIFPSHIYASLLVIRLSPQLSGPPTLLTVMLTWWSTVSCPLFMDRKQSMGGLMSLCQKLYCNADMSL